MTDEEFEAFVQHRAVKKHAISIAENELTQARQIALDAERAVNQARANVGEAEDVWIRYLEDMYDNHDADFNERLREFNSLND